MNSNRNFDVESNRSRENKCHETITYQYVENVSSNQHTIHNTQHSTAHTMENVCTQKIHLSRRKQRNRLKYTLALPAQTKVCSYCFAFIVFVCARFLHTNASEVLWRTQRMEINDALTIFWMPHTQLTISSLKYNVWYHKSRNTQRKS